MLSLISLSSTYNKNHNTMDRQSVYTLSVGYGRGDEDETPDPDSRQFIQQKLLTFLLDFEIDNIFIYRCESYT
jgi:hypothetical protein